MAQAQAQHKPHQLGVVKGKGTATSDSIPAKLSKGEYIIPAHIVKQYGKAFFNKLIGGAKEPDTDDKGRPKLALGGSPKYDANGRLIPDAGTPNISSVKKIPDLRTGNITGNQTPDLNFGTQSIDRSAVKPQLAANKQLIPVEQPNVTNIPNNEFTATKAPGTGLGATRQQLATVQSAPIDIDPYTGEAIKPANASLLKAGNTVSKVANTAGQLGKGLAIGEALQTGKRALYNTIPKNMVGNVLGAGGMALLGDNEAAKQMLFGQPVNNLSPLAQGGVDLVRKVSPNAPASTGADVNPTVNPTTQPPRKATSVNKPAIPETQTGPDVNNGNNGNTQTGQPAQTAAPTSSTYGVNPKTGVRTLAGPGYSVSSAQPLGAGRRQSTPESLAALDKTMAHNADPLVKEERARQAQIVDDRYAWARNREAERQQQGLQNYLMQQIQQANATLASGDLGGKHAAAQILANATSQLNAMQGNQQQAGQFGQTMDWNREQARIGGQIEAAKMAQTERLAENKANLDWQLGARNKFGTKLNPNTGEWETYAEQGPIAEQQWADTQQSKQAQSDHQNVTAILKTPDKYDQKVVAEAQRHANTPAYKAWLASQKG